MSKITTLGISTMAALVLLPSPVLANAGPPLPWREPLPLQASLIGLLFMLSAGVALCGAWMLRRVERVTRRQREKGA